MKVTSEIKQEASYVLDSELAVQARAIQCFSDIGEFSQADVMCTCPSITRPDNFDANS